MRNTEKATLFNHIKRGFAFLLGGPGVLDKANLHLSNYTVQETNRLSLADLY